MSTTISRKPSLANISIGNLCLSLAFVLALFILGCSDSEEPMAATYQVQYFGNGHTGGAVPVDDNMYTAGSIITVMGNTGGLEKAGYDFAGWNTDPQGLGTSYEGTGSATLTMGENDLALYAAWIEKPSFTVRYDGNGHVSGALPEDQSPYFEGDPVPVKGLEGYLIKTGHTFAGWNTSSDGSGTALSGDGSASFTMGAENVVFYAQWSLNPTVTDIDGNEYYTVTIGDRVWMAQNLRVIRFNDGTPLEIHNGDPQAWENNTTGAYIWYQNDPETYGATYGALYNFYATETEKLCPVGWHVSTESDWEALADFAGGFEQAANKIKSIGTKTSGSGLWNPNLHPETTNETGFTAHPAGIHHIYTNYVDNIGDITFFWANTPATGSEIAKHYYMFSNQTQLFSNIVYKMYGCSIRCVKD